MKGMIEETDEEIESGMNDRGDRWGDRVRDEW